MVIAIEGMDGVGKTEIAKYISEKYGFSYIYKPLNNFYNSTNSTDDMMKTAKKIYEVDSSVLRAWYIGLGNVYTIQMNQDKNIVVDRHYVSNYYWNGDEQSDPVFETLINTCGKPDLTIILYASVEERMKRIMKRDSSDPDLKDPEKYDDGLGKMSYFVQKYNLPYKIINTENLSIEDVKSEVDISLRNVIGNCRLKSEK